MVQFEEDSIGLVIVGDWNVRIFTPEWITTNISKSENIQIEFSINNMDAPIRFTHNDIRIIPSNSRFTFSPQKYDTITFSRIENMVKNLCESLYHTPITAYGINFKILDTDPNPLLLDSFNLTDDSRFSDAGFEIKSRKIIRVLQIEDGILNFKISNEDGQVHYHFNFHYTVTGAEIVTQSIIGKFEKCKKIFEQIITNIYRSHIEDENWEG